MPDHLPPITVEIPVTWTAEQALAVWEMRSDAQASTMVARVLGLSTSNRLIVQRLNHRPQRPSCCSIKTAILPSRPTPATAVARSGGHTNQTILQTAAALSQDCRKLRRMTVFTAGN